MWLPHGNIGNGYKAGKEEFHLAQLGQYKAWTVLIQLLSNDTVPKESEEVVKIHLEPNFLIILDGLIFIQAFQEWLNAV
jgi:hypothetical protein